MIFFADIMLSLQRKMYRNFTTPTTILFKMKKLAIKLFSRVSILSLLPVSIVAVTIMFSCKTSHSVKEIQMLRGKQVDFDYEQKKTKVKIPKTKADAMTKDLFMQSKRPNIELPHIEGAEGGIRMVSEEVTFTNAEIIPTARTEGDKVTNLNEVQHLNEVVVTAKSRFTPEQNGRVNVDFIVRVPQELLSSNWRVLLSPKLLDNDSIVPLKDVVIKGEDFYNKQKQDYADYDSYVKSIVRESDYDSVFVDFKGVREDISFQQGFYYDQYHKQWRRQKDYETWKSTKDDVEALAEAKKTGYDLKIYHENARKARQRAMKELAKGKDTTGLFAKYMKNFVKPEDITKGKLKVEQREDYRLDLFKDYSRRAREQVMQDWANGKDTAGAYMRYLRSFDKNLKNLMLDGEDLRNIPKEFRDIYREGRKMEQITNQTLTEKDSIEIAKNRYMFEDIALNDMKRERQEAKMEEMIPFPYEQNTRLDTVIRTDRDFVFYYKQDYPVRPGMKRLRLVMNSQIDAIDRSRFIQSPSDTLSYFISSLSQLVDTTLIVKTTTIHRDVYNTMVIYPKFQPGKNVFNVNYSDNKEQTNKLIDTYKTFTGEGNLLMDSVVLRVTTSLDGEYEKNLDLSMKRADALKAFFVKALGGTPQVENVFKTRYSGEDWSTMARLIIKRTDMPNRSEILDMLTQAVNPDEYEKEIKKTYPVDFKIIKDSIYPMLNKAEVVFNMTRPGMTEEITVNREDRPEYAQALKYLQDREYWKALDILGNYPDYNTALCLVCMGYNAKALELLESLKQTGNTEYLRAILSIRSGNDQEAIDHLVKACELDPSKAYRAPLDPEVAGLVNKYNLQERLINTSSASSDVLDQEVE